MERLRELLVVKTRKKRKETRTMPSTVRALLVTEKKGNRRRQALRRGREKRMGKKSDCIPDNGGKERDNGGKEREKGS